MVCALQIGRSNHWLCLAKVEECWAGDAADLLEHSGLTRRFATPSRIAGVGDPDDDAPGGSVWLQ